jgi:uncharacterized protein YggT (Ycf19 family)
MEPLSFFDTPALCIGVRARHMIYQIVYLLLDVAVGLVAGMCLLRAYMQFQRIPLSVRAGNPAGPFIFALSDWIVLPLRRVLPRTPSVDLASVLAAFLLELQLQCLACSSAPAAPAPRTLRSETSRCA